MPMIDLRSDTVTRPTPEMRRAMAEAEVGDDVFGDDPTVIALEERAAELLGKEAGLFVASGAMGNLVAQMAHVGRGQETIAGEQSHIVLDEAASHAVVVGSSVRVIREQPDGTLDPAEVRAAFRDPGDVHEPITGLVAIWNARRARKLVGGGMRQVGVLAAPGLIALRDGPAGMIERLADDHANARRLAEALSEMAGIGSAGDVAQPTPGPLDPARVTTNFVVFKVARDRGAFIEALAGR